MGNKAAGGHSSLEEQSSMEVQAQPVASSRDSISSVAAEMEISLDSDFITTGKSNPKINPDSSSGSAHRRKSSHHFLGAQGDQAVANSPRKKHSRTSSVPQQVLKFEQQSMFLFFSFVVALCPPCSFSIKCRVRETKLLLATRHTLFPFF